MEKELCIVFFSLLLVASCLARTPPSIPTTFHARVSATLLSGREHHKDEWKGAGMFALDLEKGFARTDIHLWGKESARVNIHTLDRYDVESSFVIDNQNQKCQTRHVTGQLTNPLKWVGNSSFAGESEYLGNTLENWEYKEGNVYYKIAVKKGTDQPVLFITHSGSDSEMLMVVREWSIKPSPQWARYIPTTCIDENNVGDVNGVVYFANNNWDCADVACTQTVPAGTGQPDYACAEFVARCLAYGGFIPNIGATDPQGSYYQYSYNGQTYDLCLTTSLSSCLGVLGFQQLPAAYASVNAGVATFGDGGDGYFSHAVIGVAAQTVDAHNNARYQIPISDDLFNGVDAAWGLPNSPSTGTSSPSGSYYSTQQEASSPDYRLGGAGSIYNNAPAGSELSRVEKSESKEFRLVEEKPAKKFF